MTVKGLPSLTRGMARIGAKRSTAEGVALGWICPIAAAAGANPRVSGRW